MNTKIQVSVAILTLLLLVKSGFPVFASQALQLSQMTTQSVDPRKAEADKLQQEGKTLADKGEPQAALQILQQALTLYRNLKDQAGEGSTLRRIGNAYNDLKDYPKALEYQQQALVIAQAIKDHNLEARALHNIGLAYANLKDSKNAIEFYQKSLFVSQQHQNYEMQVMTLNNLGSLFKELKEYSKSLEYYKSSLLISQDKKYRVRERDILSDIGHVYREMGKLTEAINFHKKSLIITRELKNRLFELATLGSIAIAYTSQGNGQKAIEHNQEGLLIARELGNREYEYVLLSSISGGHQLLGNLNESIKYLQKSLLVAKEINHTIGQVESYTFLGLRHTELGAYGEAIKYLENAIEISQKDIDFSVQKKSLEAFSLLQNLYANHVGEKSKVDDVTKRYLLTAQKLKDTNIEIVALHDSGIAYTNVDSQKAINYLKESLSLAVLSNNHYHQVRALISLGNAYLSAATNKISHAEIARNEANIPSLDSSSFVPATHYSQYYKSLAGEDLKQVINYSGRALDILNTANNQTPILERGIRKVRLLHNLSIAHRYLGDVKSINYANQAIQLAQESPELRGHVEALSLVNAAEIYRSFGNNHKAIDLLHQSVNIARNTDYPSTKSKVLSYLGFILHSNHLLGIKPDNLAEAESALFEAINILEHIRGGLGSKDDLKISIFEQQQETYRLLEDVLIARNKIEESLEVAERGRARTFVEQLAKRLTSGTSKAITHTSQLTNIQPPNIQQIKALAQQKNAIFIVYSVGRDGSWEPIRESESMSNILIWVIKPSGEVSFRQINPFSYTPTLESFVTASRQAIGVRGRSDIEIAVSIDPKDQPQKLRQLHQLLIEPIADLLPTNPSDRIVFMPQGSLFLVPFPALQDANGKYLIEKHTILTAPSIQVLQQTRQLKATRQANTNKSKALVLGNPVMPKVALSPGRPPQPLTPLPGAEREAIAIAPLLNTQPIIGKEATKAVIMQKMPQANIIHLATHGLLDDQRGLGSAIALAPDPTQPGDRFGRNNALLTAEEILDMQLNADLVVLSACDTGRGRITGDGVIGLSRSFISAGVPSVIVSLWAVPDAPTAELMTEFYKNWKERNLDKAQALRQAMLTTMKTHPNPRDWAAFTLIGEAE